MQSAATLTSPAPATDLVRRVRLNHGVQLEIEDNSEFTLRLGQASARAGAASEWMLDLLRRLAAGEVPEDELQTVALANGGPAGLYRWIENLRRLDTAGMVARSLTLADQRVSAIRPLGAGPSDKPIAFDPGSRQRLSRFAVLRMHEGVLIAQHPRSHLVVELGPLAVDILARLAGWVTWREIAVAVPSAGDIVVRAVLEQLARAAVIEQQPARTRAKTQPKPPTAAPEVSSEPGAELQWNVFDWWLHSRTRNPRIVTGWGGSYPGRGRFERLPAHADPYPGRRLVLPIPDPYPATGGRSLSEVMESRRTIRVHDDEHPIRLDQLAELLYRTMRTRAVDQTLDGQDEILDRPYPSGGALHELEVYPVVRSCDGLAAGMWHYRSDCHALEWVTGPGGAVDQLLWAAQSASTMSTPPQLLLVISARFGRVMWKYESIAYALTLKHVGVLMQSLYLVATDMDLSPAAIGSGDAASFAAATGRDWMAEGSVGEFIVGSRPAGVVPGRRTEWEG